MQPQRILRYLAIGLRAWKAAASMCRYNLLVDDFSRFSDKRNSLGMKASDDGSMRYLTVSEDTIFFAPQRLSYFYETVPCVSERASGYNAIAFTIKAPQDASITLEMQTADDCTSELYNSTWRYVMNFTGEEQRIVAPMSSFQGARTNGIAAFNWATWETNTTDFVWELGDIELICGAVP